MQTQLQDGASLISAASYGQIGDKFRIDLPNGRNTGGFPLDL